MTTPIKADQDYLGQSRILNLQAPQSVNEPARLADLSAIDGTLQTASFTAATGRNYAVRAGASNITITMPSVGPVGLIDDNGNWGLPAAAGFVRVQFPSGETFNGANTYDLFSSPGVPSSVVFNKRPGSTNWFMQSGRADGAATVAAFRHVDMTVNGGAGPTITDEVAIPFNTTIEADNARLITYASDQFTIQKAGLWTVEWQHFFGPYSGLTQAELYVAGVGRSRIRAFLSSEYACNRVLMKSFPLSVGDIVYAAVNLTSGTIPIYTVSPALLNNIRFIYEGAYV